MSIKQNDWIEVEYTGKLKDGTVFDTSKDRAPLKFKVGSGMVIPGFDSAVIGLEVGSDKTFTIPFSEAYGPKNTNAVEIPKTSFKEIGNLEKDKSYNFMTDMGPIKIDVQEILDDKIKAIVNHPLAGEDLNFEIKVVKVLSDKEIEELEKQMASQQSHQSCSCGHEECKEECDDKEHNH
jgi:peptidylprolyl isomerase